MVGPKARCGRMGKISVRTGFDPRTVQPVASRCSYSAIRPFKISLFASDRVGSRAGLDAVRKGKVSARIGNPEVTEIGVRYAPACYRACYEASAAK